MSEDQQLPEDRGHHETENRESHPNAAGPQGLEGGMGLSSERSDDFTGIESTGTQTSAQGATDGETPTYTDEPLVNEPLEGPEGVEENTADVPAHPSDPDDHPGHTHG